MKSEKIKKISSIILFNIAVIGVIWFISDVILFVMTMNTFCNLSLNNLKKFYQKPLNPVERIDNFFTDTDISDEKIIIARKPDGLEYKSVPVLLFGCSYAYGLNLKDNQTFGYKLSNLLKRPVYNRALGGASFQMMYYQTTTDEFFSSVPYCDTVIYMMISDHFRRMFDETFLIIEPYFNLHYKFKNGEFKMDDYNNPFIVFYKYNYTLRAIRKLFHYSYRRNPDNFGRITDEALAYFIKTRENLENHWHKKINFVVIFYQPEAFEDILAEKLKANDFKVVSTKDLTKENLYDVKYLLPDNHPKEDVWNLLTPLFVEKMKQEKVF